AGALRGARRRAGDAPGAFGADGPAPAGDPRDAGGEAPPGPVRRAGGGEAMSQTNTPGPAKGTNGSAQVEVDGLRQKLLGLGLCHAAEALAQELSEAVKHDRAGHVVLDRLLSHEVNARDERRVRTSLKLSNLPPGMTLGNFDFGFQPSIERRQIE